MRECAGLFGLEYLQSLLGVSKCHVMEIGLTRSK